jgi:hypothetical protein
VEIELGEREQQRRRGEIWDVPRLLLFPRFSQAPRIQFLVLCLYVFYVICAHKNSTIGAILCAHCKNKKKTTENLSHYEHEQQNRILRFFTPNTETKEQSRTKFSTAIRATKNRRRSPNNDETHDNQPKDSVGDGGGCYDEM